MLRQPTLSKLRNAVNEFMLCLMNNNLICNYYLDLALNKCVFSLLASEFVSNVSAKVHNILC